MNIYLTKKEATEGGAKIYTPINGEVVTLPVSIEGNGISVAGKHFFFDGYENGNYRYVIALEKIIAATHSSEKVISGKKWESFPTQIQGLEVLKPIEKSGIEEYIGMYYVKFLSWNEKIFIISRSNRWHTISLFNGQSENFGHGGSGYQDLKNLGWPMWLGVEMERSYNPEPSANFSRQTCGVYFIENTHVIDLGINPMVNFK